MAQMTAIQEMLYKATPGEIASSLEWMNKLDAVITAAQKSLQYKLTVTKHSRRYFSTTMGDLPNFTQAEAMYWKFFSTFPESEDYKVYLFRKGEDGIHRVNL